MGKPAPSEKASKAEHKKHAREVLDDPEYKVKPKDVVLPGEIPDKEHRH